ncbi:hypothetical protein BJ166DRAFT_539952 [Pestalotiopsis sp. NC0098]|nr:hypothetical protein BJ166DRAFT_539952 [Pestalotiopsis sp. NC0098]
MRHLGPRPPRCPRAGSLAGMISTRSGKCNRSTSLWASPRSTDDRLRAPGASSCVLQRQQSTNECRFYRFYVNTFTKKSQWEKPTAPAVNPNDDSPAGPPPGYTPGGGPAPSDAKTNPFHNDSRGPGGPSHIESEDEALARKLQEEENARAGGSGGGAASSYMNAAPTPPQSHSPYPDQLPPRPGDDARGSGAGGDKAKGFLGKLFSSGKNKYSGGGGSSYGGGGYPQGGYQQQQQYGGGYGGPPPQQGYYNGPPQQQGGYYGGPQQGYGGYPQQGGYGGGYQQRPQKSGGGGMGMMGGAALGVGAGVLGGALIAHEIDESQEEAYQDGYNDGNDGGDYGGGDDFGGDF